MNNDITWVDVVGYKGIYEVSNDGQVRTKEGKTTYTERHGVRKWKQRVLKQKVSKDNCCRVSLWKDGKEATQLVHRLVAIAFIPNPEEKGFVNHKDGNRLNNHVSNLEWNTYTENTNHAFDNDLIKTGCKVMLIDILTNEEHYFRSKQKACEFLGKGHSYIYDNLKRGKDIVDGYRVVEV